MDTKISREFWTDPEVEVLEPEVKLVALWILTAHPDLCGYVEVSDRRFTFETGLDPQCLTRALEALPKTFIRTSKGIWIRNFIRKQIGDGDALRRNNLSKALVRAIEALSDPSIRQIIQREYPELSDLMHADSDEDSASPCQALTKGKEKRRVEKSREEGDARGNNPHRDRLGKIFGRRESTAWSEKERRALRALSPLDPDDLELIERYYRLPEPPRGSLYRRKDLLTLLNNWPGEVDRARAHSASASGGSTRVPSPDPVGWEDALRSLYPDVATPESFSSLTPDLQREVRAILASKKKESGGGGLPGIES